MKFYCLICLCIVLSTKLEAQCFAGLRGHPSLSIAFDSLANDKQIIFRDLRQPIKIYVLLTVQPDATISNVKFRELKGFPVSASDQQAITNLLNQSNGNWLLYGCAGSKELFIDFIVFPNAWTPKETSEFSSKVVQSQIEDIEEMKQLLELRHGKIFTYISLFSK